MPETPQKPPSVPRARPAEARDYTKAPTTKPGLIPVTPAEAEQ